MPQSMQVVRGLLAANPDYWPAKTNADGTNSPVRMRHHELGVPARHRV